MPAPYLARNRRELGAFLLGRRQQILPSDVGLPVQGGRRVKGLRREEVASLAGVGLTWYTWFEQGRDINVSPTFLTRVSRALRLNRSEQNYLFFLAGQPVARPVPRELEPDWPSAGLRRLVDGLVSKPAYLKNVRWDILHWNRAAAFVFGDFGAIDPADRNAILLAFGDSRMRRTMVNWESDARRLVARLRADYTRASDDQSFRALIERLSEEFGGLPPPVARARDLRSGRR